MENVAGRTGKLIVVTLLRTEHVRAPKMLIMSPTMACFSLQALLRRRTNMRKVQAGFPLLFVVMVALVSTLLGYLSHS